MNLWFFDLFGFIGLVYFWIGGDVFWLELDIGKIKFFLLDSVIKIDYIIYFNLNNFWDLVIDLYNEWVNYC